MFDDIAALFFENVVASYEEYRDIKKTGKAGRSRDVKKAVAAASALYHYREYLPTEHKISRKDLAKLCPEYDLVGDIANASKHRELTQGNPTIINADQIFEQLIITEYKDEQGPYQTIEKAVQIKLLDGSNRDVFEILTAVINYWFKYLSEIGIIKEAHQYPLPVDKQPKTREESTGTRLDLEIIRGVRFCQNLALRQYNYETGKVEPRDLTGCTLQGKIYRPQYEFELELTDDKTGEAIKIAIPMTTEESMQFAVLSTEKEREDFQRALLISHQSEIQELLLAGSEDRNRTKESI